VTKQLFRNPYGQKDDDATSGFWNNEEQQDNAPAEPLQPRCWRCFAPVQQCKCQGGPQ
jgi:hypothetical protein